RGAACAGARRPHPPQRLAGGCVGAHRHHAATRAHGVRSGGRLATRKPTLPYYGGQPELCRSSTARYDAESGSGTNSSHRHPAQRNLEPGGHPVPPVGSQRPERATFVVSEGHAAAAQASTRKDTPSAASVIRPRNRLPFALSVRFIVPGGSPTQKAHPSRL